MRTRLCGPQRLVGLRYIETTAVYWEVPDAMMRKCRTVAAAVRRVGRHSRVHFRERGAVEGKGLVEGMKNQTLRQVFFGS